MSDEPDPPRKFYEFKPSEIESVNAPTHEAQASAPIRVQDLLRQAGSVKPGLVSRHKRPATTDSDVHSLLRANVAQADAAGLNALKPIEKRPSRRKRDFWFLMISGNLFFVMAFLLSPNPAVFVFAVGGMGLLTAGLTWVMWFVMDDY